MRLNTKHDTVFYGHVGIDTSIDEDSFTVSSDTWNGAMSVVSTAVHGYASLYLKSRLNNGAYTDVAQLYSANVGLHVTTNTAGAIYFKANRTVASSDAMAVNTYNTVTVHTTLYNNSDSKLKYNQQTAYHDVIQNVC